MEWRMPVKLHTAVLAKKWSSKAVQTLEPSMFPAHGTFGGGRPTLHLQQCYDPDTVFHFLLTRLTTLHVPEPP